MGVGNGGGGVVGGRCLGRGGGLGDCEGQEGAVICLAGWREYLYINARYHTETDTYHHKIILVIIAVRERDVISGLAGTRPVA